MEESEKINGKKRLPSIPSNFVTLVQLQERWIKERELKEKEENQRPEQEEQGEDRVNDHEVDGRGSRKNGDSSRNGRESGKRVPEWKPKEEETAASFVVNQSEGVEQEKKGKKPKNKKKWNNKRKNKKEEKAGAENEGEGVVGTAANAPLPASAESDKGKEEEKIADEVHAPKQASAEKENVEARTEDRTVEIGRKLGGLSMNGEIRRWGYHKYGRQNGGFNHRGGNRKLNGSNYGKFNRLREPNQRNEGMVWLKKGEGSDGNMGGIQSSSCSAKELD